MTDVRIDQTAQPTGTSYRQARRSGMPMNACKKRPTIFPWPPVLLVTAVIAGLVLGHNAPYEITFPMARPSGLALIVTGLLIDIWAMAALRKARTTIWPNRSSSHLVVNGPFSYTRNPIYISNVMLLLGAGLLLGNFWFIPLAVIDAVLTYFLAIRREEKHLNANFGYKYEAYCRAVRRWI
ncbi:isoprenylcysteine carboxylmethyltransferase family protein [Pseudohoeflea suaedae]|uniref:Isoprenylcysteine carboxylmethyltransferase family protein n=1 Tax=Pseudohoeflea suaedae TaxID=877384 RepID=A0A4R5PLE6_9HYPH|nr:isoprenylcysteine carboxylmethyltransferase family protein [Pseudohoeflea suaedae]TDH36158.1 isoprenylcysteine carboxylmethyltransferase family protein [Pseudohoeflea suaedae]